MIKGVIFDLDGVICFTDEYHYLAWKSVADEENIYFDRTINNRLRGVSRMESLDIILEKASKTYTAEEKVALATRKNDIYKTYLEKMSKANRSDDVIILLEDLKKEGFKLAIGSSSKNTKMILKQLEITDYFDAISDGTNITNSKPDPEVFLKAADMLGLRPNECAVVEDAYSGILAANRGGFTSIGIGDARNDETADYRIDNILEVEKIVMEAK